MLIHKSLIYLAKRKAVKREGLLREGNCTQSHTGRKKNQELLYILLYIYEQNTFKATVSYFKACDNHFFVELMSSGMTEGQHESI